MAFGVPHPQLGRGPAPNLEAARFYTALLRELKVKTEGNRTAEENLMLDEVLDHLRLRELGLQPVSDLKEARA